MGSWKRGSIVTTPPHPGPPRLPRPPDTSLAVGRPFLHVEGSVANRCLAGSTGEAMHVPGHLESMHDLLEEATVAVRFSPAPRTQESWHGPSHCVKYYIYICTAPRATANSPSPHVLGLLRLACLKQLQTFHPKPAPPTVNPSICSGQNPPPLLYFLSCLM